MNADGEMLLVNREVERMLGYQREEMLGQPVELLLEKGIRELHEEHRAKFATNPHRRAMGAGLDLAAQKFPSKTCFRLSMTQAIRLSLYGIGRIRLKSC